MIYYLSMGANIGNREAAIRQAMDMIEQQVGHILRCSAFYYSAPWGFASNNDFCNICCSVESVLSPHDLLRTTQSIERALGRTRKSVNGIYHDRTIDIDIILCFDGQKEITINTPDLTIPHPLWQERDFVRIPLQEICHGR